MIRCSDIKSKLLMPMEYGFENNAAISNPKVKWYYFNLNQNCFIDVFSEMSNFLC